MKSHININNSIKLIITYLLLLTLFLSATYSESALAQSAAPGSRNLTASNDVQNIVNTLANSSCPDAIKQLYLKQNPDGTWAPRSDIINKQLYLDGTLIVARDGQNNINLSCANATTLEKIAVRIFVMIISIVGLVLAFGAGKSALTMMTAFGDQRKYEEGVRGLVTSVTYAIGAFFFYTVFVFVLVGIFGFGRVVRDKPEYNLFCQQKIIFNLTFDGNLQC